MYRDVFVKLNNKLYKLTNNNSFKFFFKGLKTNRINMQTAGRITFNTIIFGNNKLIELINYVRKKWIIGNQ